jgi:hypothetical protein
MHTKTYIYLCLGICIYLLCRNLYIFVVLFYFIDYYYFIFFFKCLGLLVLIAVGSCRRLFKNWILFWGIHWYYLLLPGSLF